MSDTAPADAGHASWINTDGSFGALDTAPEGIRDLVSKKGYKSVEDLGNAYVNAQKKLGVDPDRLLTIPKDGESWDGVFNKLGRPETPDGYEWDVQAPEGITIDDGILGEFGTLAHELGLSKTQAKKLVEYQLNLAAKGNEMMSQQAQAEQAQAWNALKEAKGIKSDTEMNALVEGAKKVAGDLGILDTADKKGWGNDPDFINAMMELKSRVDESALPRKRETKSVDPQERISAIMNDPAFVNKMDDQHEALIKEFHQLHRMRTPA